jgi:hypothetical protein
MLLYPFPALFLVIFFTSFLETFNLKPKTFQGTKSFMSYLWVMFSKISQKHFFTLASLRKYRTAMTSKAESLHSFMLSTSNIVYIFSETVSEKFVLLKPQILSSPRSREERVRVWSLSQHCFLFSFCCWKQKSNGKNLKTKYKIERLFHDFFPFFF